MTPEAMARIHARAMTVPPPWNAQAMSDLLSATGAVFVWVEKAFALGRVIADEAELLTIAVDPEAQGQGLGRVCLHRFIQACDDAGAGRVFLEVAASNSAARSLYRSEGFAEDGIRRNYYRSKETDGIDAILMSKVLAQA